MTRHPGSKSPRAFLRLRGLCLVLPEPSTARWGSTTWGGMRPKQGCPRVSLERPAQTRAGPSPSITRGDNHQSLQTLPRVSPAKSHPPSQSRDTPKATGTRGRGGRHGTLLPARPGCSLKFRKLGQAGPCRLLERTIWVTSPPALPRLGDAFLWMTLMRTNGSWALSSTACPSAGSCSVLFNPQGTGQT